MGTRTVRRKEAGRMSKAWYDIEPWEAMSGMDWREREALEKRFRAIEEKIVGLQNDVAKILAEIKKLGGEDQ
jgi:predicted  nucleic acid-binding Zn-ribbon protein